MASSSTQNISAAQRVFSIPELYEMILLQRDPRDILDNLHHGNKLIQAVKASATLRQKLFLAQRPELPDEELQNGVFAHSAAVWEPNVLLFTEDFSGERGEWLRRSVNFRLGEDGPEYVLHVRKGPLDKDEDSDGHMDEYKQESKHNFLLTRRDMNESKPFISRILPSAYLSMHMSDRATPIALTIQSQHSDSLLGSLLDMTVQRKQQKLDEQRPDYLCDRKHIWVPAGKTLGDILRWTQTYYSTTKKRGYIVNGIILYKGTTSDDPAQLKKIRRRGWWVLHVDGNWYAPLGKGRVYGRF